LFDEQKSFIGFRRYDADHDGDRDDHGGELVCRAGECEDQMGGEREQVLFRL